MNKFDAISELIERMNEKKALKRTCMFVSEYGESVFEFDVSNQAVMHVVSQENNLIAVALGQQIIYSVDLAELDFEIKEEEDSSTITLSKDGEVRGNLIFMFFLRWKSKRITMWGGVINEQIRKCNC